MAGALIGLLCACSTGGAGTGSVGADPTDNLGGQAGDQVTSQAQSATDLVACLADIGVEAETLSGGVEGLEGSYLYVMIGGPDDPIEWNVPGGLGSYDPLKYGAGFDDVLLVVNGVDRSGELSECVDSTGFYLPDPEFDAREETIVKQAMADASNDWAACAREAGLPMLVDATVETDNWETQPSITVPATTSVELFKDVLGDCPPLHPDRDLTKGNLIEDGAERLFNPKITFDAPEDSAEYLRLDKALTDHIEAMYKAARG
ncbi:MAG: hypothetical protein LBK95_02300 [Bifidobacteriaceae bacterium]|nr:hypothetical protein [Bifidobacteriaceae bacterium]